VRRFLTPYKEIAGMARPIPFLVRIACRYPDRDCYPSAGNAAITDLNHAIILHQRNNALKQKARWVQVIPEEAPDEPNMQASVYQPT
jgi:hypothetical protein